MVSFMSGKEGSEDPQFRIKKLRRQAYKIVRKMDEHQLFGFILVHGGRKAIPKLMKLWGESEKPKEDAKPEEKPDESEEKPKGREEDVKPAEDLIELVVQKPKKD